VRRDQSTDNKPSPLCCPFGEFGALGVGVGVGVSVREIGMIVRECAVWPCVVSGQGKISLGM
jgi:hypothetical protein